MCGGPTSKFGASTATSGTGAIHVVTRLILEHCPNMVTYVRTYVRAYVRAYVPSAVEHISNAVAPLKHNSKSGKLTFVVQYPARSVVA